MATAWRGEYNFIIRRVVKRWRCWLFRFFVFQFNIFWGNVTFFLLIESIRTTPFLFYIVLDRTRKHRFFLCFLFNITQWLSSRYREFIYLSDGCSWRNIILNETWVFSLILCINKISWWKHIYWCLLKWTFGDRYR